MFIHEPGTLWHELGVLCEITHDILVETGIDISPKPLGAGSYNERTPLMGEIRRDGRDL